MVGNITMTLNKEDLQKIAELVAAELRPIICTALRQVPATREVQVGVNSIEGYYTLSQLCSTGPNSRDGERIGLFPFGKTKIIKMIKAGEFPKATRYSGHKWLWDKDVIHEYIQEMDAQAQIAQ